MGETKDLEAVGRRRLPPRTIGIVVTFIAIGSVVSLFTCMQSRGMDVHIENETDERYGNWVRTTCDVINYGDPGNVTISVTLYQSGREVDYCEQEIHLNKNEATALAFYPEIDQEGPYTYKFQATEEKPD